MSVDWTKPLEAYHPDGRVEPVTRIADYDGYAVDDDCVGVWNCFNADGSNENPGDSSWRIRNVADPDFPAPGMTLRDWFAGQAMAAIISKVPPTPEPNEVTALVRMIAVGAYNYADAMLATRKESQHG